MDYHSLMRLPHFTGSCAFCMDSGRLPAISPLHPPASATPTFGIGMLPLPTLFLLLFLLPGVAPPAAAQPALNLQPSGVLTMMEHAVLNEVYFNSPETDGLDGATGVAVSGDLLFVTALFQDALSVWRVNAETGFLSQTAVYQDSGVPAGSRIENVDGLVNGLDGATGVAVSGDGNLLFVTGRFSDALSVWRVNKAAGSLEQIEVYLDNERDSVEGIDGLGGASGVAVSGNLLFVTAQFPDDALSVWQVNEAAGTLRRTALYRDGVGIIDGLDGAVNVAVSDDGKLLFVTARNDKALSVWRVNAGAGSLIQTDLQRDGERGIDGLGGAWNVAVSGNLLFVTSRSPDDVLSVWRVNAEAGTLIQMDLHRNGERGINSLFEPTGLAVSDDGNLLFVSAFIGSNVLSVWRVNAEAGTLSQTVVYPNRTIDGLDGANNVAVSGDLLFVTGFFSDALGVWHINNAEVSLEVPTVIRVQLDRAVAREVMVTVTAQSGARMETAAVTLSPGILSEDAIFPATTLSPGRWIFTARADPPDVLNMIAARTVVQVLPPLLSLEAQQQQLAVGNTVTLTVRAIAGVPADTNYRITALNRASPQTISHITVMHPAGSTEVTVFFPGQSLFTGQWEFSIQLPDNSPFRVGGGSTAIARIVIPLLQLVPLQDQYALSSTVTLSVRADLGALTDATYDVIALDLASGRILSTMTVEHLANTIAQEVSFPARLFSSSGQWEFSIVLPLNSPFRADSSVTISILALALSLRPDGELTMMEYAVLTGVYFDSPETKGLDGVRGVAVSGDLLFVTAFLDDTLSVWRVNAEAGTLSQTAVYQDLGVSVNRRIENVDGLVNGLTGASGIAVSGDGGLLFVTAQFQLDGALSVWRVNAEAGTLSQTALYENGIQGIDGLSGTLGIAVSGDSDLLFVTAFFDDTLSVWRVNAEAGTLSQTALYKDGIRGINGLAAASDIAVSGDGKLLFVTGGGDNALSLWRVNAEAGTLSQAALYENGIRGINGLAAASGVAVSGDGELLFVTGAGDNALSLWRVNAEAGTLSQAALYEDGIRGIDGLSGAQDVAVSGNGDLLFVTGAGDNALSLWRVNAEADTLSQAALYKDGIQGIDGLSEAMSVAVSDGVLFVTGTGDNALGAWHINNAEVPLEVQTVIRVQTDRPVTREVMVTVTAQNGARTEAKTVTLSPDILSDDAIFPAGTLSPGGRWIFTARTDSPDVLNTIAAQTVVQVLPPLLSLKPQQELFGVGNMVTLTVRAIAGVPADTTYRITVLNRASLQTIPAITVMHPAGSTEVTVFIPGQSLFIGQWEFSIQLPDNFPFRVGGGSTATARIAIIPLLQLVPLQDQYVLGSTVTLSVQANVGVPTDATYEVIAVNTASEQTSFTVTVEHFANTIAQEVSFPAQLFSSPGQWEISIVLPPGSPFQAGSNLTIFILAPALSLHPGGMLARMEHAVLAEAYSNSPGFPNLFGILQFAVSDDLLFVTSLLGFDEPLSVWRVNAEAGTLIQPVVYQNGGRDDSGNTISGLSGAAGIAVSGNLLFVVGFIDNALSVWRVNRASGTLGQTAVYRNGDRDDGGNQVSGLSRAVEVAVSGDLLFVTSANDDALSVWQVNEAAGTLRQTAVYRHSNFGGLDRVLNMAVSDNLLFVAAFDDNALSAWRINAEAGTLSRTALYQDSGVPEGNANYIAEVSGRVDGLNGVSGMAVSGDVLFVASVNGDTLSAWRINAEAGTLRRADLYQGGASGIDGLESVQSVAVSGDVLFAVAREQNGILSIWRINAEAQVGILRQTALHRDDVLLATRQVGVSGDLLFANAESNAGTISVWHINNAGVPFGAPVLIRVQPNMPVVREVMVTVTARNGAEMARDTVTLSPENLSAEARFAPGTLEPGRWIFTAQAEPSALLDTGAARIAIQVLVPVDLTLNAPENVTVGSTFPVTVGVAEETPLPEDVSVTAIVSFRAVDGEEIQAETVVLSTMISPDTRVFRAPVTAGVYTVAVSGQADETAAFRVTVTGASASVTVVPVAVMLRLNGPAEAVSVGQDYTVMVDTTVAVPAGTTLEVTVRARAGTATALQKEVSLTETISRLPVSFTAPARAGEVTVTATALAQTSSGSRQVAVSDATTLTVGVSAREVQLVLSEVPLDLVAAESTFSVTVSAAPTVLAGTTVQVTVRLAAFASEPVLLTPGAPTASVLVTAPATDGAATLFATGEAAADSTLELNVLATEAVTVQVQVQVSLSLRLEAPPEVTARNSFAVTVFTEPEVPAGTTVTVTVVFDGTDSSPVVLSAETSSTTVILTARRIGNNLALMTSSVVTVAEPNALQVMVADADASVNAVAQSVELTLMVSPQRVNIGEEIEVTVGVAPALLADTTLTVEVMADAESKEVTLTDATPSRQVRFTAMEAGLLEVRTQVLAVAPADLVTVENTPTQTVQVREQGTVDLTLDAPSSVTVGNTFTVTVGVNERTQLPESVSVSATVSFRAANGEEIGAEAVMLSFEMSSDTLSFTAPVNSGIFVVEVSGSVEDNLAIQFVTDTSAQVSVEPVRVTLTLRGPQAVTVGQTYTVTVGTEMTVPEGTALEVTVSDGTTPREVSLTEENAAEEVSFTFTAPASAGPVTVTATATVQTDENALEVAAPAAKAVTVGVSAREVQLVLLDVPDLVAAGSTFPVTVGAAPAVLAGTTVQVTVRLAAFSSEPVLLTPRAPTASVLVTAPAVGGSETLFATGEEADDNRLELNVLEAQAAVQVRVEDTVELTVNAPSSVTVGSTFPVTVGVAEKTPLPESVSVTATVSFRTADGEEIQAETVVLTSARSSARATLTAPGTTGTFTVNAAGTASVPDPNALELTVTSTGASVQVAPMAIALTLTAPGVVNGGSTFTATVGTDPALPVGTVVNVALLFNGVTIPSTLSAAEPTASVEFTAPSSGLLSLTASVTNIIQSSPVVAVSVPAPVPVQVTELVTLALTLSTLTAAVEAGSTFSVTVSSAPQVPEGAQVSLTVTFDGVMRPAVLSARTATESVVFMAPDTTGTFVVNATGTAADTNALRLTVNPTSASVEVVPVAIALTLTPTSIVVQANAMFSVELGTDRELPFGTVVNVDLQLNGVTMPSTLSAADATANPTFTAPSSGLLSLAASVTNITQSSPVVAVSAPAPVPVQVTELVTLELALSAPSAPVAAGSTFSVTVSSTPEVPTGAEEVSVVLTFGEATETALLSAGEDMTMVEFTAPGTMTGTFAVNAVGTARVTDPNALQLTVNPTSASVRVAPVAIMLTLTAPGVVDVDSRFTATVGTDPALPTGTEVAAEVRFGSQAPVTVMLNATTPTASVDFTAPLLGLLSLTAKVSATTQGDIAVEVSDATPAMVQVTDLVTLELTLTAPSAPVAAGSTFSVTVSSVPDVPASATVSVTLTFGEAMETAVLSENEQIMMVEFTAPNTTGTFTVNADGMPSVEDGVALELTVNPTSVSVEVVPVAIALTLTPTSIVVRANAMFSVEVGTDRDLPTGTVVAAGVQFDSEVPSTVTLSAASPTASLEFTAPSSGLLSLTAAVINITQSTPVVAVSVPAPVPVQVTELVTLALTLSTLTAAVAAGSTFSVTVSSVPEVPMGAEVSVMVIFDGVTRPALLSASTATESVVFTAPDTTGTFVVNATGTAVDTNALRLTVNPTSATVEVVPIAIALTLTPTSIVVQANAMFSVELGTDRDLPFGTVVNVDLQLNGVTMPSTLSAADATASVEFTAPSSGLLSLTAAVTNITQSSPVVAVSVPEAVPVQVTELVTLALTLSTPSAAVEAGSTFSVTVSSAPQVPEGAQVSLTVTFDGVMRPALLSARTATESVVLMAPDTTGTFVVNATGTAVDTNALRLTVNPTSAAVEVVPMAIALTLAAPGVVNGGSTFTATLGTDPVLPAGAVVNVDLQFNGVTIPSTLSAADATARVDFTAPSSGLLSLAAAVTNITQSSPVVAVSAPAAVPVQVTELVTLALALSTLTAAVEAGSTFSVTVSSTPEVPTGAEVSVMVIFDGVTRPALLSASMATESVVFTAPDTTGTFVVNATGTAVDTNALRLTVNPTSAAVEVVPVAIALTLAAPGVVNGDSPFTVTVGTTPTLPVGTVVNVELEFNGVTIPRTLSAATPTASLAFTAPSSGLLSLTATVTNITQSSPVVAVSVPVPVPVQVTELVTLALALSTPSAAVEAGSTFSVTVSSSPTVPAGATVSVSLTFGEAMETAVLLAGEDMTMVEFTAPNTTGTFVVNATGTAVDTNALRLTVNPTSAAVQVVPEAIALTLTPTSIVVQANAMFSVELGTDRELPFGTVVNVDLHLNGVTMPSTLSAADATASVDFTAPSSGLLSLTAAVTNITQSSPVVAVSVPAPVPVQVTELVTLALTLSTPSAAVEAGSTFSVTVSSTPQVPEGAQVSLTVTFDGVMRPALLSARTATESVVLMAPDTTGTFVVNATGTAVDTNALRLTVNPTSASVQVVPMAIALTLAAPGVVNGGSTFTATLGTDPVLPFGTVVNVDLQFNGVTMPSTLSAADATARVDFTAPSSGLLSLAAAVTNITQSSPVVAVSVPAPVPVQVTELVTLALTLSTLTAAVEAGSTFSVTVSSTPEVPTGAEVSVMVIFDGVTRPALLSASMATESVVFTAPDTTGTFVVNATGTAADTNALRLTVNPTSAAVEVVPVAIALTLTAPGVVNGDSPFTVTVGTTPTLPVGTVVNVELEFNGVTIPRTLSAATPTASLAFTAPSSGLLSLTATVTNITQSSPVVAVSVPVPVPVQVTELVTLALALSTPSAPVEAGSTFSVTVSSTPEVPTGAEEVSVVLTFGEAMETAVLLAGEDMTMVEFTAPNTTGTFVVNATGTAVDTNALRLTVNPTSASVQVVPVAIALTLTAPGVVNGDSPFTVTVGTTPTLPFGTVVNVDLQLNGVTMPSTLSAADATARVEFTAPSSGLLSLTAAVTNITQSSPVVAVSVPAPVPVQVTELVTLALTLSTPSAAVEAGSTFSVTVSSAPQVPEGAQVSLTVTFDGVMRPALLSARTATESVVLMAPDTTGTFVVNATGTAVDTNALRLTVNPTSASVQVVPMAIALTLAAPGVVNGGSTFTATLGTDPVLPFGTVVNVDLQFNGVTMPSTLSAADATARVDFTAPSSGLLSLAAAVINITQSSPVVAVSVPAPVPVQVTELVTLALTLSTLTAAVEAGSTFSVTVSSTPEVPTGAEVSVMVIFDGVTRPALLSASMATESVVFTAPDTTGTFVVNATGTAVDTNALRLTVNPTSAAVEVVPVAIALTLAAPGVVNGDSPFTVTVGTTPTLPVGTVVNVELEFNGVTMPSTLSAADATARVDFTAPSSGLLSLAAAVINITQSSPVVAVSVPAPVPVQVTELVTLALALSTPSAPVAAGSTFSVTVSSTPEVPTGAEEVSVVLTFGEAMETAVLLAGEDMTMVEFTAPNTTGTFVVNATGTAADTNALRLTVNPTSASVEVVPVAIALTLTAPGVVNGDSPFTVTVGTTPTLPFGTVVNVDLQLNGVTMPSTLSAADATARVDFTAPSSGLLSLTATVTNITQSTPVVAVSVPAAVPVQVTELVTLGLQLSALGAVAAGSTFSVTVSSVPEVPMGAEVSVMVIFDGVTRPALLSASTATESVVFTAPDTTGTFVVNATGTAVDTNALRLTVNPTSASVQVVPEAIALTLATPGVVNGDSPFTVTVGTTPTLPVGTVVNVELEFNGVTIPRTLSAATPTASLAFTAPSSGLLSLTASVANITQSSPVVAVSVPAPVPVQVTELVTLALTLSTPSAAVEAGSTFSVTVSSTPEVPEGAQVSLTVTFDGVTRPALLSALTATESVVFMAPDTTGTFVVNATGTAADTNALRLTVNPTSAAVEVVPVAIALTLTAPGVVNGDSPFTVTVGTTPTLPFGTVVNVELEFNGVTIPRTLSAATPTASLEFTAPSSGLLSLTAAVTNIIQSSPVVAVSVPVPVPVQVTELVTLALALSTPSAAVEAGSTFSVTVSSSPTVPAGATVSVSLTFGEAMETAVLLAGEDMTMVEFTAPNTTGTFTVNADGMPSVEDGVALELTVNPTSASVEVVPVAIALTLTPTSIVVQANAMFSVELGTDRDLPFGTVVNVDLQLNGVTMPSTLSAADATARVEFTAPSSGLLSLTAAVTNITQSSPVVAVSVPEAVPVQVTELVTLALQLSALGAVAAGSTFSVTVSSVPEVPMGAEVSVMVLFDGVTRPALLSASMATESVVFTAPDTTGTFVVNATGTAVDTNALELTVNPTSASVQVVPEAIALTLAAPGVVNGDSPFTVTVGTTPTLPVGTVVNVDLEFNGVTIPRTLSAATPTASLAFTAPSSGLLSLTASVTNITQSSPVVAVSVPAPVPVQVTELVTLALTLSTPSAAVEAGSTFSVTVSSTPEVPEGAQVSVTVIFDGVIRPAVLSARTATESVVFTAPDTTGTFVVNATGTAADTNALRLTVNPTSASVEVVPVAIALTLTAPGVVNGDSPFTVTVGTTPTLPFGTVVNVDLQLNGVTMPSTLSAADATASLEFTAPSSGLLSLTATVTNITQSSPVVAVSVPAPVPVQVTELVTLALALSTPSAAVEAGSTFSVTVSSTPEVPTGAQVSLTVTFDGVMRPALLSASMATESVVFTAPDTTGTFVVNATGTAADTNALRLTVNPTSAAVEVVPVAIALTLTAPGVVNGDSPFTVTVGTTPTLPFGTVVNVDLQLNGVTMPSTLSAADATARVDFTAPSSGLLSLTATVTNIIQSSPVVAVSVPEAVPVQVTELVTLALTLSTPSAAVEAGSTFSVTVSSAPEVPEGAQVSLTVTLGEATETALLLAGEDMTMVEFTAPGTMTGTFAVNAVGTARVTDAAALELTVNPTSASVRVVPVAIMLTLAAPGVVDAGSTFTATVGTDPALPTGTEVAAEVRFGSEEPITVMLSAASPTASLDFTAPSEGSLFLAASVINITQGSPVVAVSTPVAVRVRAGGTLELTLNTPKSVTVGSTFPVTVGVDEETPLAEDVSVTAIVSFRAADGGEIQAETVVLTSARSSVRATFTAPDTAGRYTVAVRGAGGSLLPVIGTAVQMTVEPVLVLDVPEAPIYRGVMFPVRVRLLGGLLEDNGSVGVTVYLRNAVTGVAASTRAATLSTAASSMVLMFEAIAGEAAITAYSLTTEDIDQTGLAPMTSLSLQSAAPATVFVTRINADLSGNGVFDADDRLLIARGLLTQNYLARSAGGLSELGPDALQARLSELAGFADISGNGRLDIVDMVFLTRNIDATASDLQSRVNAGENPFAYLCGSTASNACEGIDSPHQNITLPSGIQYEAIGEVLDSLRRVPQPPILSAPTQL